MSEFDLAHPGWMNDRRMLPKPLTAEEFDDLVRPVVGLEVSRTWKGHGTAIFLELGALTPALGNMLENLGLFPFSSKDL